MSFFRAVLLICFGMGLFVQVAAQAASMPQVQVSTPLACQEMAQAMPAQASANEQTEEENGPCDRMALDCLIAMNCIPPIALAEPTSSEASFRAIAPGYEAIAAARLKSGLVHPEPPPPQIKRPA